MKNILFLLLTLFIISCQQRPVTEHTVVGIVPYKGISSNDVKSIQNAITEYYGVKVEVLEETVLPKSAFINIKSPRYRADSLIAIQRRNAADDTDYIMGLTVKDISVTKREKDGSIKSPEWRYNDFGVMGLAYCPGNSCVISGFRLKHKDKSIQFGRFKKVAIHELGHNFWLPHCRDKLCVMTDAVERISTIDNAKPELCIECRKKLNTSR